MTLVGISNPQRSAPNLLKMLGDLADLDSQVSRIMRDFEPNTSEREIELEDVFKFFSTYLTTIVLASTLGAVLGVFVAKQFPVYNASAMIRMHPESQGLFGDLKALSALSGKSNKNNAESFVPLLESFSFRTKFVSYFFKNPANRNLVLESGLEDDFVKYVERTKKVLNPHPIKHAQYFEEFFAEHLGNAMKLETEDESFIRISLSGSTPDFSLKTANALAKFAVDYLKESRRTETDQVRAYLKRKISEVEAERDQILGNLQNLQTESEHFGGSLHESGFFGIGLDEKKFELHEVQLQIAENQQKASSVMEGRTPADLSLSQRSIVDSLQSENQYLEARKEALQKFLDLNSLQKGPLATTLSSYHLLRKELDLLSNIFTVLTTNQVQIDLDSLSVSDKISVFELARPQNVKLRVPSHYALVGGFIFFFALSSLFSLFNLLVSPPVTHSRDLASLGLQYLGSVPKIKQRSHKTLVGSVTNGFPHLNSSSKEQMAFNNICRKTVNVFRANDYKIAAVSSPHSGDGKSTLAFNLALGMANMGFKVLLVDGDHLNPKTTRRFGLSSKPGVLNVEKNSQSPKNCIFRAKLSDSGQNNISLDILPAGTGSLGTMNSSHSSAGKLESILNDIARNYDFVLIDTPPVLSSIDGNRFFEIADTVLLQTAYFTTKKNEVLQVLHSLPANKEPHIYSLLNFVPKAHSESYTGYSYKFKNAAQNSGRKIKLAHSSDKPVKKQTG